MRKVYSLALPIIAIALMSGCGPRRDTPVATLIEINALSRQLCMTPTQQAGMVVFTGSQGTIVFNPRVYGIYVGRGICFRGFRPMVSATHVSVPPNFVEQCAQMLGSGIAAPAPIPGPATPGPAQKYHVVLDPGHGGSDPGAIAINGAYEKNINLSIAGMVAEHLISQGIQVTMTRENDTSLDLNDRPAVANRIGADAFISIHADASEKRSVTGFTVFVVHNKYSDAERAAEIGGEANVSGTQLRGLLATNRAKSMRLASLIRAQMGQVTASPDRGTQPGPYRVLKRSVPPAVLIETGFLSNSSEANDLTDWGYQSRIANAIASGIIVYLQGG